MYRLCQINCDSKKTVTPLWHIDQRPICRLQNIAWFLQKKKVIWIFVQKKGETFDRCTEKKLAAVCFFTGNKCGLRRFSLIFCLSFFKLISTYYTYLANSKHTRAYLGFSQSAKTTKIGLLKLFQKLAKSAPKLFWTSKQNKNSYLCTQHVLQVF